MKLPVTVSESSCSYVMVVPSMKTIPLTVSPTATIIRVSFSASVSLSEESRCLNRDGVPPSFTVSESMLPMGGSFTGVTATATSAVAANSPSVRV